MLAFSPHFIITWWLPLTTKSLLRKQKLVIIIMTICFSKEALHYLSTQGTFRFWQHFHITFFVINVDGWWSGPQVLLTSKTWSHSSRYFKMRIGKEIIFDFPTRIMDEINQLSHIISVSNWGKMISSFEIKQNIFGHEIFSNFYEKFSTLVLKEIVHSYGGCRYRKLHLCNKLAKLMFISLNI